MKLKCYRQWPYSEALQGIHSGAHSGMEATRTGSGSTGDGLQATDLGGYGGEFCRTLGEPQRALPFFCLLASLAKGDSDYRVAFQVGT
jgi:hypothetical protein